MRSLAVTTLAVVLATTCGALRVQAQGSATMSRERIAVGCDIARTKVIAVRYGARITSVIPSIGAALVEAPTPTAAAAFEAALIAAHAASAVESPNGTTSFSTSGPSSVPIINPAGSPTLVASQPAFGSLYGWISGLPPTSLSTLFSDVVVAVLDSGVDSLHPLVAGRLHPASADFVDPGTAPDDTADGIDQNGDGIVDEAYGHGTFIAGLVLAACPSARVMALRVVDDEGRGSVFAIAQAIDHAERKGAHIINLSLGLPTSSPVVAAAIDRALQRGVTVFASAGNGATNLPQFPASHPGVLAIAATYLAPPTVPGFPSSPFGALFPIVPLETLAPYSNWGFVDFAAHGSGVTSAYPGNRYVTWSGTSMASGVAAGLGGLALALSPALTPTGLESLMEQSCTTVTALPGTGPNPAGAGSISALLCGVNAWLSGL